MTTFFFRNDDVRETLDNSLVAMTELLIKYKIPISHAVEPANVSPEVVDWLLDIKKGHPSLIEIIQHGYSHRLNYKTVIGGKIKKGEFGGARTYKEQYDEIKKGKDRMDDLFREHWFPLFTFPYGARNDAAINAVSDAGFLAVNGSMGISWKHRIAYPIGRFFKKEMIAGRKVSWNLRYKPNTNLFQIDTSISLIKKFYNEQSDCEYYTFEALKRISEDYMKQLDVVGFVLHHRYDTHESIQMLENFIQWLKTIHNINFSTQEAIYKEYA
jgi:peptidoglycan/xylan/chitin deacetylase (PgdA/CDA1 family)